MFHVLLHTVSLAGVMPGPSIIRVRAGEIFVISRKTEADSFADSELVSLCLIFLADATFCQCGAINSWLEQLPAGIVFAQPNRRKIAGLLVATTRGEEMGGSAPRRQP